MAGGLNTYGYVNANPLGYVDPYGLWQTPIHNRIIDRTFSYLPPNLRDQIKKGSRYADEFQDPKDSFMHAMRSKNQSIADAARRTGDFIKKHMKNYACELKNGNVDNAYFELGMAIHPLMDSTSPSHENFKVWKGLLWSTGIELMSHYFGENTISESQMQDNINLINQYNFGDINALANGNLRRR